MTSGLARFGRPTALTCNLGTSGTLTGHSPGSAYNGTFSVTNRVGTVTAELVSATPALPAGWALSVNQGTGVVTLSWPAATPAGALPNLGFETGDASWLLGNAWVIDTTALVETGTQSAKYNGPGQSSLVHAQAVPVTPGTTITASARISKGTNREDFGGGAVVLQWLDAAGVPIDFAVGNVVNTGSSAFQTSSVTATAPAGSALVRLAVSGTRDVKGRARDKVYVDNLSWNHSYAIGGSTANDYAVVIRVRDGRGCQATLSQTIPLVVSPVYEEATFSTFSALTTTHNASFPPTVNAGDLLIMIVVATTGGTGTPTISGVSGFTELDESSMGTGHRGALYWKNAVGNEGGTTVNVPTSVATTMVVEIIRIRAGTWSGTPQRAGQGTTNTSATPNPPNLSSGYVGLNALWIATTQVIGNTTTSVYPFAENNAYGISGGTSQVNISSCTTVSTAGTLDPGTFTISASSPHRAYTIAVRP